MQIRTRDPAGGKLFTITSGLSGWLPAALGRADTLAFTKPPSAASLENRYRGAASAAEAAARSTRPTAPRASDAARKARVISRRSRMFGAERTGRRGLLIHHPSRRRAQAFTERQAELEFMNRG